MNKHILAARSCDVWFHAFFIFFPLGPCQKKTFGEAPRKK